MKSAAATATLTSLGVAVWACSTSTSLVQSEYDRDARFAAYETFAIAEDSGQLNLMASDGYQMAVANEVLAPDLDQMARATIVESLEKKKLTLTESVREADVVVTYFINLGASPEVLAPDYRVDSWSTEDELGKKPVTRGMLVVDVLDPAVGPEGRSYLVWRGWVENSVDLEEEEPGPRGARLTQALRRILARYPE